ncbi:MAG: hypothetical protein FIA99_18370 [Ruminiclostridium sp.]|nr:hypothetical protein [Ruminiclostridium sp.]
MDYILLAVVITLTTVTWLISFFSVNKGAKSYSIGVCATLVYGAGIIISAFVLRQPLYNPKAILFGAIAGAGDATGYYLIMLYCLKIGPSGPTVAMYNLSLVWPIVTGVLFFSEKVTNRMLAGIILVVLSLTLMAWNRSEKDLTISFTCKWFLWAFIGWAIAGITLTCQLLTTRYAPGYTYSYLLGVVIVDFVLLFSIMMFKGKKVLVKSEIVAGVLIALISLAVGPISLGLISKIPAVIIFPAIYTSPIVIMLLVGKLFLNEKLNKPGWAASIVGVIGIVLLNIP